LSRTILLIGASGGLGRRFAAEFGKSGYNLALHYHEHKEGTDSIERELKSSNVTLRAYQADIQDESQVASLVKRVNENFGGIDILINNAGITKDAVSWKLRLDIWNEVLGVNLTGPFLCIKHVLPIMREKNWGRIINISSVVPQIGVAGTAAYSASKAGVSGLTKTIAKEVVNKNITVNTIALGYFREGMISQIPEDIRNMIRDSIPKKEFGDPMDIVNCIRFLIDENSSYITGQTININGGLY
jgi:3-oxoacyl-[acyl-carrier protein] reductase